MNATAWLTAFLSVVVTAKLSALALAAPAGDNPQRQKVARTNTIVVTGATGKVGSRLVRRLLLSGAEGEGGTGRGPSRVVALVRNATKARSVFAEELPSEEEEEGDDGTTTPRLEIVEAAFGDRKSLESAFRGVLESGDDDGGDGVGLFLACGNVPDQLDVELNVARAAAEAAGDRSKALFCVKLSTAEPLVRGMVDGSPSTHRRIERELPGLFASDRYAILRPNVFLQMLDPSEGGRLFGIDANGANDRKEGGAIRHVLAENGRLAMVDCDDVAACAEEILLSPDDHGGMEYELTGPSPSSSWTEEFQEAASLLRPLAAPKVEALEGGIESTGMPQAAKKVLGPFLSTILSYTKSTDHVEKITGRPPGSVANFVLSNPRAFLPRTYSRLIATGKASSFREAAKVEEGCSLLEDQFDKLGDDELLVRVQVAGVNGGADTFSVTRAGEDATDFPLGSEGTGIVVAAGGSASRFRPGDTAVFVGGGAYGEYVRVPAARCAGIPQSASRKATPAELTALRISALTALVALTRTCPVREGDVVLVTACCGGTGHFAAQVAKNAGATVVGTVGSARKVAAAEGLGCIDRVVDLSRESLGEVLKSEFPRGVDVCYEGVGGRVLGAACENLADGGRVLIVGSITQYPHNDEKEPHGVDGIPADIMAHVFRSGETIDLDRNRKMVGNVWGDLFKSGEMGAYRDRVYELHDGGELEVLLDPENEFRGVGSVCDAVDHMLSRRSVGKVTVAISE